MKLKEKLEILRDYYDKTRGIGHTTLMKKGTDNVKDKLILGFNKESCEELGYKYDESISWHNLNYANLLGQNKPLVIDNGAMCLILNETLEEIDRLEEINKLENMKMNLDKLEGFEAALNRRNNSISLSTLHTMVELILTYTGTFETATENIKIAARTLKSLGILEDESTPEKPVTQLNS
jgi:hypothetical protein